LLRSRATITTRSQSRSSSAARNIGTAAKARDTFLAYWAAHVRLHFRLEDGLLFPAYAGHGHAHDALVLRALGEHMMIRHRAHVLSVTPTTDLNALKQLGRELAEHVRLEEREVFPLIERVMPERELDALARALEDAQPGGMTPSASRDTG
jgi:hypothetical protein